MDETSLCAYAQAQVNLVKAGELRTESNQQNSWFSYQNLFGGNIPNNKEQSHQRTSSYNVQDSEIFTTTLYYICYIFLKDLVFIVYVCMCTICMPGAQRGQKRVSDSQEVEWATMTSGKQTQVLCKRVFLADKLPFQPNLF